MTEEELVFDPSIKKKKKSSKSKSKTIEAEQPESASAQASTDANGADEITDLMASLATKKKKTKSKSSASASASAADEESTTTESRPDSAADGATAGGEDAPLFDAKKKKKKSKAAAAADFDALLEKAGVSETKKEKKSSSSSSSSNAVKEATPAVNERGERDFTYPELLTRFFKILADNNPELASERPDQKYKIPPPEVKRDGKKTLFVNIKEISDRLHRPTDHVTSFLYAELGTTGSVDGSNRLVIKGRYQQKQIETVLRKYIVEYVTCKTCKSINTVLKKENRLFFLDCNSCGSRRSVSSIKTGYQAIIRRQKV
ncbi:uncharacterized protein SAPINGB_P000624 [Magnusiomyces paraingens]|uniref:Translation initiation factor IF2/IF5 domain-containing protein n=1 Tax=Magnusiomyces paraingens TaxID=2606893 RepID=A0A5E8B2Q6_9ASCO|nr:uncharacterized protein SAPINGB_P000624 [Saprochaete ingens]VVT45060.1 unnamed protein product [Saprochaete ingens]